MGCRRTVGINRQVDCQGPPRLTTSGGEPVNTSSLLIAGHTSPVAATRVRFSAHACFRRDYSPEARACLQLLGRYLASLRGLAFYVDGVDFLNDLLVEVPELRSHRSEERRVGKEGRSRWSPAH